MDPSSSVEATARGGSESSREEQPQPSASSLEASKPPENQNQSEPSGRARADDGPRLTIDTSRAPRRSLRASQPQVDEERRLNGERTPWRRGRARLNSPTLPVLLGSHARKRMRSRAEAESSGVALPESPVGSLMTSSQQRAITELHKRRGCCCSPHSPVE